MLFNSSSFPGFLLGALIAFYAAPRRIRLPILLITSYIFYAFWDWRFCGLLALSSVIDYYCALKIGTASSRSSKRTFLLVSLLVNLGILGLFKYFNFFVNSASSLFEALGLPMSPISAQLILPVGISFYTFQSLAYTIDVYRGQLKPTRDPFLFLTYVSFFPQLVAGPIERAQRLLPQLKELSPPTRRYLIEAIVLLVSGYIKKVAISDNIAPSVDSAFANWEGLASIYLWEGAFLFTLQIYFDFSGYSDIARGVARLFGIDLMVNFKQPYLSTNITEFWRRWHISLSAWLRDYLYLPLGGNRKGKTRTDANLLMTMLLGGLWHGANFTFVLWGLCHGLFLAIHKAFNKNNRMKPLTHKFPSALIAIVFTHLLVVFTFVIFRSSDISSALGYLSGMFVLSGSLDWNVIVFVGLLYAALLLIDLPARLTADEYLILKAPLPIRASCLFAASVLIAIFLFQQTEEHPFIYFQF